ncbi:hypothetical protein K8R32_02730 [bacterium]|nr:hypothetical protein [bacterium]
MKKRIFWLAVLIISFLIFWAIDAINLPTRESNGSIKELRCFTKVVTTSTAKPGNPKPERTKWVKGNYFAIVEIGKKSGEVTISKEFCASASIGETVNVIYKKTRLLGMISITAICR